MWYLLQVTMSGLYSYVWSQASGLSWCTLYFIVPACYQRTTSLKYISLLASLRPLIYLSQITRHCHMYLLVAVYWLYTKYSCTLALFKFLQYILSVWFLKNHEFNVSWVLLFIVWLRYVAVRVERIMFVLWAFFWNMWGLMCYKIQRKKKAHKRKGKTFRKLTSCGVLVQ